MKKFSKVLAVGLSVCMLGSTVAMGAFAKNDKVNDKGNSSWKESISYLITENQKSGVIQEICKKYNLEFGQFKKLPLEEQIVKLKECGENDFLRQALTEEDYAQYVAGQEQ